MKKNNTGLIIGTVSVSFGSCLAMIISYTSWKSIGWAILHGLLSWIYVFYYWGKYIPR